MESTNTINFAPQLADTLGAKVLSDLTLFAQNGGQQAHSASWGTWFTSSMVAAAIAHNLSLPEATVHLYIHQLRVLGYEFPTSYFQREEVLLLVQRLQQHIQQFHDFLHPQQATASLAGWCPPTPNTAAWQQQQQAQYHATTAMSIPQPPTAFQLLHQQLQTTLDPDRRICSQYRERLSCSFGSRCRYLHSVPSTEASSTSSFAPPQQQQQAYNRTLEGSAIIANNDANGRKRAREVFASNDPNILITSAKDMTPHRAVNTAFLA